jgi:hypothetical protein
VPRANRRRRDDVPLNLDRAVGGSVRRESYAGGEWFVRRVTGAGASRAYLCPGCQQTIAMGTAHVVSWPADGMGGLDDRRHWHTGCWEARDRRHPRGATR